MPENPNNFHELKKKLDDLQAKQNLLSNEINELKREVLNQMPTPGVSASQEIVATEPIHDNIIAPDSEVINLFEEVKKSKAYKNVSLFYYSTLKQPCHQRSIITGI